MIPGLTDLLCVQGLTMATVYTPDGIVVVAHDNRHPDLPITVCTANEQDGVLTRYPLRLIRDGSPTAFATRPTRG